MAAVVCISLVLMMALGYSGAAGWSQVHAEPGLVQNGASATEPAPAVQLPDIPTLMHEVEAHQKAAEAIQKDYLYRSVQTLKESDGHGGVKKMTTKEYDVFWVEGVRVYRLTKKDGKELSPEEQKKEDEKIDKKVARAKERRAEADRKGKETNSRGDEEITASRFLELGKFTNPRRVKLNGRDTIAVDYAGDPKARTRNRAESVIRDLVGTVWVDEQDQVLVKVEGHFVNSFKVGAGLVANIQKGTSFGMEQRKINNEVWLPAHVEGQGAARFFLLFSFNGSAQAVESDYRKFKATSTILPGMRVPASQ